MKCAIVTLVSGWILFAGCNPKFYSPNSHNVPLITSRGEKNLGVSGNGNQVEIQVAYGVSKNFAVKADGNFFIPQDLENGNGGSGKYFEIGGGYFKPLAGNFVFETYGLLGFGDMENHLPSTVSANPSTTGNISANVLRYGIQPGFGYKKLNFSVAVSSRLVNLNYSKIEGDLIFNSESQAQYLNDNKSSFLIEPALTLRGGLKNIKLQLQFGYSLNASNSEFRQDDSFVTFGLNFNLK